MFVFDDKTANLLVHVVIIGYMVGTNKYWLMTYGVKELGVQEHIVGRVL